MIEGEEELLEDDELGTNLFVYLVYFVYLLLIVCWVTENQKKIIEGEKELLEDLEELGTAHVF